jgi:hypothetical protein
MRVPRRLAIAVFSILLPTAGVAGLGTSSASAQLIGSNTAAHAASPDVPSTCDPSSVCLYSETGYHGIKYDTNSDNSNLDSVSFRNLDESVASAFTAKYVRLYYSPNYDGAWVCLDPGTSISNVASVTFNNGSGEAGFGQSIYQNVASVGINSSKCTNPVS